MTVAFLKAETSLGGSVGKKTRRAQMACRPVCITAGRASSTRRCGEATWNGRKNAKAVASSEIAVVSGGPAAEGLFHE